MLRNVILHRWAAVCDIFTSKSICQCVSSASRTRVCEVGAGASHVGLSRPRRALNTKAPLYLAPCLRHANTRRQGTRCTHAHIFTVYLKLVCILEMRLYFAISFRIEPAVHNAPVSVGVKGRMKLCFSQKC